jgi:hypothetical protein
MLPMNDTQSLPLCSRCEKPNAWVLMDSKMYRTFCQLCWDAVDEEVRDMMRNLVITDRRSF